MKVLLPAILSGVSSRKDRSYSLKFETRELSGESASTLLDLLQQEGFLLFSPNNDLSEADVPTELADASLGKKTPSARQRAVIYLLWEQANKPGDFETYYRSKMEYIIELLKEKIDG